MKIDKKGLLIGGGAAIVAAYLLLGVGGADGNGAVEQIKERAGGILGAPAPGVAGGATPQNMYSFPAETFTGFPEPQEGFDLDAWLRGLTPEPEPEPTPTPGVDIPPGTTKKEDLVRKYEAPAPPETLTEKTSWALSALFGGWTPAKGEAAFERGREQEIAAASYLAGHPTLEMRDGVIVKKQVMPAGAAPAVGILQKGFVSRVYSSGGHVVPGVSYYSPGAVSKGATPTSRQEYAAKAGVTSKPPKGMTKKAWSAHLAGGD